MATGGQYLVPQQVLEKECSFSSHCKLRLPPAGIHRRQREHRAAAGADGAAHAHAAVGGAVHRVRARGVQPAPRGPADAGRPQVRFETQHWRPQSCRAGLRTLHNSASCHWSGGVLSGCWHVTSILYACFVPCSLCLEVAKLAVGCNARCSPSLLTWEAHQRCDSMPRPKRRAMVANRSARVDWATAEALAFGALMLHRGVRPPGYPTPQSLADPPLLPADLQPSIAEVGALSSALAFFSSCSVRVGAIRPKRPA